MANVALKWSVISVSSFMNLNGRKRNFKLGNQLYDDLADSLTIRLDAKVVSKMHNLTKPNLT